MSGYVHTNIGSIPMEDYLEIKALELGFSDYESAKAEGFIIGIPEESEVEK